MEEPSELEHQEASFTYVQELPQVNELLGLITRDEVIESSTLADACEKISNIFEKYQLQPALLDPHLESILTKLFVPVRGHDPVRLHPLLHIVYILTKVRGHKTCVKFFPHEVKDLEPAFELLQAQGAPSNTKNWETTYVLLLWMSIIARVPFNLASIDSLEGEGGALIDRIMSSAMGFLDQASKARDGAAVLIAQLLTRGDVEPQLIRFTDWAKKSLETHNGDSGDSRQVYLVVGIFTALAGLFKSGERGRLRSQVVNRVFDGVMNAIEGTSSTTKRKLSVKLAQRMALTFLQPRNQLWRYRQKLASLEENLSAKQQQRQEDGSSLNKAAAEGDAEDEEFDVEEEVEHVIDVMLTHLKDTDTVVRWSAAKGVGRITARLPLAFADEVLSAVLELLSPAETDGAWHGACLAVAELCRRGLIVPERLNEVLPLVYKALVFELPRSNASIGDHVRDAACYVAWAFSRAFHPSIVSPHMGTLSSWLLVVSTTDREVHCRRAASAALQEASGRQGSVSFPMGIDIVTTADYFSLGQRSNAFLQVLPKVSAMGDDYGPHLAHHLATNKLQHWEQSLRQLAAMALGRLAALASTRKALLEDVLPSLLPRCTDRLVPVRHGAVWGVAELLIGLQKVSAADMTAGVAVIDPAVLDYVVGVVRRVQEAELYRGRGGEMMREAVCHLVGCIATAGLVLESADIVMLQGALDENVRYSKLETVEAAVNSLTVFARVYYLQGDASPVLAERYAQLVRDGYDSGRETEAARGCCLAVGGLPGWLLAPAADKVLSVLTLATKGTDVTQDPEMRRNAVHGLVRVCVNMERDGTGDSLSGAQLFTAFAAIMSAFGDYATDNRGDVGSWVREAAMEGSEQLVRIEQRRVVAGAETNQLRAMCAMLFPALVKQAVEKIDRVRGVAGAVLFRVLHGTSHEAGASTFDPFSPDLVPDHDALVMTMTSDRQINWAAPSESFPILLPLLSTTSYHFELFSGLAISIGGLTESLFKHGREELLNALDAAEETKEGGMAVLVTRVAASAIRLLRESAGDHRVIIPTFKTLDFLLESTYLDELQPPESNFSADLVDIVRQEMRTTPKDIHLILAAISTLSNCSIFKSPTRECRLSAAEALFTRIISSADEFGMDEAAEDAITQKLETTHWDNLVKEIKAARDDVAGMLGIKIGQK